MLCVHCDGRVDHCGILGQASTRSIHAEVHFENLVLQVELYTPDTDQVLCTLFTKPKVMEATVEAQVECFRGRGALGMKDPKLLQAFGRREFGQVMLADDGGDRKLSSALRMTLLPRPFWLKPRSWHNFGTGSWYSFWV